MAFTIEMELCKRSNYYCSRKRNVWQTCFYCRDKSNHEKLQMFWSRNSPLCQIDLTVSLESYAVTFTFDSKTDAIVLTILFNCVFRWARYITQQLLHWVFTYFILYPHLMVFSASLFIQIWAMNPEILLSFYSKFVCNS